MRIAQLLVGKPVNDPVFGVELVPDSVAILCIPRLVSPEYGIGNVIGKLDDARSARIHEQWRSNLLQRSSNATSIGSWLGNDGL